MMPRFSDVSSHLYKKGSPSIYLPLVSSVSLSVHLSVHPLVRPSVMLSSKTRTLQFRRHHISSTIATEYACYIHYGPTTTIIITTITTTTTMTTNKTTTTMTTTMTTTTTMTVKEGD